MEKRPTRNMDQKERESTSKRPARKQSEYGKQLSEKQKVKEMYGLREKQFKRFFGILFVTPRVNRFGGFCLLCTILDSATTDVFHRSEGS